MTQTVRLDQVCSGQIFVLDGVRFVKLDGDKAASFVVTETELLKNCPFEQEDSLDLVLDVMARWSIEPICTGDVGRVLPSEYLYFHGDGRHNYFRTELKGGTTWDWSLASPYGE